MDIKKITKYGLYLIIFIGILVISGCIDTEIIDGDEKITTEGDLSKDKEEQKKSSGSTEKVDKVKITYGGVVVKEGEELVIYKTSEETLSEKKDTQNEETATNTQTEIMAKRDIPKTVLWICIGLIVAGVLFASISTRPARIISGLSVSGVSAAILGFFVTASFRPDLLDWYPIGIGAIIIIAMVFIFTYLHDPKNK